ncbi:c6 transcription factor prf [Ophiostoma piceae UAMH 11346]|uniref:C6 transcription factor prf n=1 Tax=Ophiostoma piceae (strain UAMH 11346) TaxID=1262450 RepID=S3C6T1_OPHP1|nr:c6 transcription factor prf [Ophiostoma piceae UAMH 11346]
MSRTMSPDDLPIRGNNLDASSSRADDNPNAGIPRQKRLACLICRRRKLKCDGRRPSCSTCARLGHQCAYDEVRKKSGPKRGYVKALEERLKQVEVMLKTQDAVPGPADALPGFASDAGPSSALPPSSVGVSSAQSAATQPGADQAIGSGHAAATTSDFAIPDATLNLAAGRDNWQFNTESPPRQGSLDDFNFSSRIPSMSGLDNNSSWEIVQLGLEEPLPEQSIVDDLNRIYFDKVHPSLPMIHRARYYAAMNLAITQRPPVCLRYAMWMSACSVNERYNDLKDLFYQRARKYLEVDYMKGFGEHMISVAHVQTHVILASYEFKMMYFPRAWMSTGQAVRLSQMIGLHRLDGSGLEVKQCIPPPRDWTEKEERRRTFWMAFCEDRYASIGTGWPMTVDERDISTILPCSEEAFNMSRPENSIPLNEAMCPSGIGQLTSFAGIVLMACLFGRNLTHLHRPDGDDKDNDLNGEFWKRHRNLDNVLLNTQLGLPSHLKLPEGISNPNVVFTNMCIYTSTICLHQAAIFKAEKNGLESSVGPESKFRCVNSAKEIAKIMRMVSHLDLSAMNPFISFCLYVAARVFVQLLKGKPKESQAIDTLRFLLTAMSALKRRNPLTESFLVQLDVDLEALGDRIPELKSAFPMSTDSPSSGGNNRPGAVCEEGAVDGILSYQREFSKPKEPPSNEEATADDNSSRGRMSGSSPVGTGGNSASNNGSNGSSTASSTTHQQWAFAEPRQLPTRDPNVGHAAMFQVHNSGYGEGGVGTILTSGRQNLGYVDDIQDMSTSPGDGTSNRPTPNSSAASEGRQHNLAPPQSGKMHSAGSSFDTSPVSPPRVIVSGQQGTGMDGNIGGYYAQANGVSTGYSTGPPNAASAAALSMGGGGSISGIMSGDPTSSDFMISEGWSIEGQTVITPVSEGVLRTMIQMGPMETMDLGGWGPSQ